MARGWHVAANVGEIKVTKDGRRYKKDEDIVTCNNNTKEVENNRKPGTKDGERRPDE